MRPSPFVRESEYVDLPDVECLQITPYAFLFRCPLWDGEKHWVPRSMVRDPDGISRSHSRLDVSTVDVKAWFLEKEGLC